MRSEKRHKVVRSYRLVFRRRWRIQKIQNWRIPLPYGIELRTIAYWCGCVLFVLVLTRLPLLGLALGRLPAGIRLGALPVLGAYVLSKWEVDGRSPHRALVGLLGYWLRPRDLSGLRRCPPAGTELAPLEAIVVSPDPRGPEYPRGRIEGPAHLLLRYPVEVSIAGPRRRGRRRSSDPEERIAGARRLVIRPRGGRALRKGRVLDVPAGKEVIFG